MRDGQAVTRTTRSRNTAGSLHLLDILAAANPTGNMVVLADNLSSHKSPPIQQWLADHPCVATVFPPVGACWLNLVESWWRLLRQEAFAGQTFADPDEIFQAVEWATARLNRRARPGVWAVPRHRRGIVVGSLPTAFEERSTRAPPWDPPIHQHGAQVPPDISRLPPSVSKMSRPETPS